MKIIKIKHLKKTDKEDYTEITFKPFGLFNRLPFTEICITPKGNISTQYAKTGRSIDVQFWNVVKSFIRTGDKEHDYIKQELK